MTGTGWNINTEGTPSNLGGYATAGEQDVGGLRTGSSTVITFSVNVPQTGNYNLSIFDGSDSAASDVSGPTNIFVRVDGGSPQEVWLPVGYNWVIWNHADTTVHLTAGSHQISLSTTGADGAATNGDAIINKIDLQLDDPAVQNSAIYEAEQADAGRRRHYGLPRAGPVRRRGRRHGRGQSVTFWVYSASRRLLGPGVPRQGRGSGQCLGQHAAARRLAKRCAAPELVGADRPGVPQRGHQQGRGHRRRR